MSEINANVNVNPNAEGAKPDEQHGNGKKAEKKEFFLVRWAKAGWNACKEFGETVKEHPVTAAILAAGGAVAGGAVTYKVMSANRPQPLDPVYAPPMIEGETTEQETMDELPNADYVDVPEK